MKTVWEIRFIIYLILTLISVCVGLVFKWKQFEILSIAIPIVVLVLILYDSFFTEISILKWLTITLLRFSVFMTLYFILIKILEKFPIQLGLEGYSNGFFMVFSWLITFILLFLIKFKI